jgi:hypothetical protein
MHSQGLATNNGAQVMVYEGLFIWEAGLGTVERVVTRIAGDV